MPQNSLTLDKVMELAAEKAGALGTETVNVPVLLVAVAAEGTSLAANLLRGDALTADVLERTVRNLYGNWQKDDGTLAQARLSRDVQEMLQSAAAIARQANHIYVTPTHVLFYILKHNEGVKVLKAAFLATQKSKPLATAEQRLKNLEQALAEAVTSNVNGLPAGETIGTPVLDQFTVDLTKLAKENKIDPIVGRKKEIRRAIEILGRQTKNNPCFVGEPGVGKTAIAEGLAVEIANGRVPKSLKNKRLLRLDLTAMVAGTKYRGEFEERMKHLLSELKGAVDAIVFIDELHTLIGAGAAQGAMDASNTLKPALARGEITCIGATTLKEFRQHIEKDAALERRFQSITVEPSSVDESIEILRGRREKLEKHHDIKISDETLIAACQLAERYISDRYLPDKGIDVVDEAGSALAIDAPGTELKAEHIYAKISQMTGIKVDKLQSDEANRLAKMESKLHERVIGQHAAISAVSRAIRRARAGLKNPKLPIGSFLFLGPTGVGKTEVARALQEFLFDDERSLIKLDMSEYMEKHSVSKLIGAPPGYVGYEEGGRLTEAVRRRPYSVILWDEIEKAHPDVFNILLQIMDDGRLTDGQGRTVDFKNTINILTSNIGALAIIKLVEKYGSNCSHDAMLDEVMPSVKLTFNPEFLNRLDEIVCFTQLNEDDIKEILVLTLSDLRARLMDSHKLTIDVTKPAMSLLAVLGYDSTYGARPMKRAIRRHLEDPISESIINGSFPDGCHVVAHVQEGVIKVDRGDAKEPAASEALPKPAEGPRADGKDTSLEVSAESSGVPGATQESGADKEAVRVALAKGTSRDGAPEPQAHGK
ncbi:MAG TPA: ATP-dependent Clp protease ATP-binding subunit [Candidatus Obscuribacterales bacterium]